MKKNNCWIKEVVETLLDILVAIIIWVIAVLAFIAITPIGWILAIGYFWG